MRALALALVCLGLLAPTSAQAVDAPVKQINSAETKTLSVQRTRLKANPGERENLAAYIIANWFVMDERGVEQGIFTFYRLLENPDTEADWDLLVEVGYPNADGYDDPDTQKIFTAIREAHEEVLVEGKSLRELGSFAGNDRLLLKFESE